MQALRMIALGSALGAGLGVAAVLISGPPAVIGRALAGELSTAAPEVGPIRDNAKEIERQADRVVQAMTGVASWYGPGFHGRKTANGERYDQNGMTAAHKSLPFDTRVRVTSIATGKSVIVTINDRGPYRKGRVIDLSAAAAKAIGMYKRGIGKVKIEVLEAPTTVASASTPRAASERDAVVSLPKALPRPIDGISTTLDER